MLCQLKKLVRDNTILMKPHFASFDKTRRSHVTVGQFARVLKQLNLLPDDKSMDVLVRAYADNNTLHDVNYVKFCNDIDTKSNIGLGEVPKDTPEYFTKPMVTTMGFNEFKDMDALKPRFLQPTVNVRDMGSFVRRCKQSPATLWARSRPPR